MAQLEQKLEAYAEERTEAEVRVPRSRRLLERLTAATVDNPVLVKEFRTRMRGTRAYWILLGYTLLIATILGFTYYLHEQNMASRGEGIMGAARAAQELGRTMYHIVFITQALMVALITPAITAGAITIEREQRSYELLVTTPLRPADLIRGKLTAAVSFVVLLLTASLPLVSLTFLVGGVSPAEIFFSYVLIALGAFVAGAIGIFWSATLRTTAVATVVTYITVGALFMLSLVPGIVALEQGSRGTGGAPEVPFQSLNPVMGNFRAVQPEHFFRWELPSWVSASVVLLLFGALMASQGMARLEHFERPRPFWSRLCATALWTAVCGFLLGVPAGAYLRNLTGTAVADMTGMILMAGLLMLCVVVPIWNSGDLVVRRGESALSRYLRGFAPTRMFGDDLPNGLPLTLLWFGVVALVVPFAALASGEWQLLFQNGVLGPGLILIACVCFGIAGVGHLLSVSVPSRWAACILTYLVVVVCVLLPYFALAPWAQVGPPRPSPTWGLLYLVPFEALMELAWSASFWSAQAPLPVRPMWIVTSALYLILGVICFAVTAGRVRRAGAELQAGRAAEPAAQTA